VRVAIQAGRDLPVVEGVSRSVTSRRERVSKAVIGESDAARTVRDFIAMASRCDYPVLILGETGTGKGLVAGCIHEQSARGRQGLVVADCATTMDSLLEADMFGHVRGAFTGAQSDREGYFGLAHGSSLLLDEADSMSRRMQGVLLRVLECGEYRRVGGSATEWSDFRLITTALPALEESRVSGEFRDDLYYRISTLRIVLPPLRDRGDDALLLAQARARQKGVVLAMEARDAILAYSWPGNVRQLNHAVDVAALSAVSGEITLDALAPSMADGHDEQLATILRVPAEEAAKRALGSISSCTGSFTAADLAAAAGTSRRTAQRHLALLARCGRVIKVGAGKATTYRMPSS
jgi:transcriptional regulator with GAF, ATPase, and Fis domain